MRIGKRCIALVLLLFAAGVISGQAQQPPAIAMITAEELKAKMERNEPVVVIDVRSSEGFANSSTTVKGSTHFKVRKLKYRLQYPPFKNLPRDSEIVTYCACPKDEASIAAAQILQSSGFTRVKVLQGGWTEWVRVNGPVQPRAKN
jgi:rhodanese-related sulfurtransferase